MRVEQHLRDMGLVVLRRDGDGSAVPEPPSVRGGVGDEAAGGDTSIWQ